MFLIICPLQAQSFCLEASAKNSTEKTVEKLETIGTNFSCKDCLSKETRCVNHLSSLKDNCICYSKEKLQQARKECSSIIHIGIKNMWFSA